MARPRTMLLAAALVLAGSAAALAGPPVPATEGTPTPYPAQWQAGTYKTYDALGRYVFLRATVGF